MGMPAISVVMSVYNGETYLHEAIKSILLQTYTDFEFIIIDDGSTDSSLSLIKSYNDNRIVLLTQKNSGLARALNNGIKLAKTPLIARMDADDIAMPERLQKQYDFMQEHPDCVACGSWADIIDKEGDYVYTGQTIINKDEIKDFFRKSISDRLPNTPFFHSSVIFRKEAFIRVGGYSEYMRRSQDVVLFNKMNKIGNCHNISAVLIKYRIVPGATGGRKMARRLLGELLIKAINEEPIDDKLVNALEESLDKSDMNDREFNYFLFLAKKRLFNNFLPGEARKNLMQAIQIKIYKPTPYFLLAVSFLPSSLIHFIHNQKTQIF
jgi:glycosyltransferase involved in cell wall biosynthesis